MWVASEPLQGRKSSHLPRTRRPGSRGSVFATSEWPDMVHLRSYLRTFNIDVRILIAPALPSAVNRRASWRFLATVTGEQLVTETQALVVNISTFVTATVDNDALCGTPWIKAFVLYNIENEAGPIEDYSGRNCHSPVDLVLGNPPLDLPKQISRSLPLR